MTDDDDLRLRQAAVLASLGPQREVAQRLQISQSHVSTLLKAARAKGFITEFPSCTLPPEEVARIRATLEPTLHLERLKKLSDASRRRFARLEVLPSSTEPAKGAEEEKRRRHAFGNHVAQLLRADYLIRVQALGVTWGLTLRSVVEGLAALPSRERRARLIDFIPVCGNPPEVQEHVERSSSHLVAALERVVNGRDRQPESFSGVGACVPSQFRNEELEVIRRYFLTMDGYRRVFGTRETPGRIDQLDAILTSVGSGKADDDPWARAAAASAGIGDRDLESVTSGNIGGVFLKRDRLSAASEMIFEELNERWTGIQRAHFERCAEGAADDPHRVGVIVIARGSAKAHVARECVRLGLVNHLIIDQALQAALFPSDPSA